MTAAKFFHISRFSKQEITLKTVIAANILSDLTANTFSDLKVPAGSTPALFSICV